MSLAHQVALAVVTASRVLDADPTEFWKPGNGRVRVLAGAGMLRSGAASSAVQAAKLCQVQRASCLSPSGLLKYRVDPEMVDKVVVALGGPKPSEERKPGYQKIEGPKGFARIEDPEERKAIAAKGGTAVPADKRAFAAQPGLAAQAAMQSVAVRPRALPRPTLTIDVAAQRLAAMHNENHISFRRTEQDRRVPSKIVTATLLGDPKPGRTPWAISAEDERQAMLERRLRQCHGSERAAAIMEGKDRATEADREKWAGLGP